MKNHDTYQKLDSLWDKASEWLNWDVYDKGVGIAEYLCDGPGNIILEFEGNLYSKPKKDLRRALKKNWTYRVNSSVLLILTPFSAWNFIGNKAEIEARRREEQLKIAAGF